MSSSSSTAGAESSTADRSQEPKLEALFGLYRATGADELLDANDAFAQLCGYSHARALREAVVGVGADLSAEPARRDEFLRLLRERGQVRAFESRIRRRDGFLAWISETAVCSRDPAGHIVFIDAAVEDITARRQRESHRHDSEEKLLTLIGSVEDCLWSVDADYRLITFNAPFIRMFVELAGHVLKAGDRVTDLIPEDWREEEIAFYQRALAGERFVVEQRYMSFVGERFYELSFNPICGPAGVTGVAVISKDSTERHRRQLELRLAKGAAESANRLKSEFLANMSHEIRTPMNGIMGMTDLLLRTPLAADQREFVNTVRVSGESLLTVINDILDFSKIEAGKLQFENIEFDLPELIDTALDLFAAPALTRKLELGALIRPDVPTALRGDPSRLRQVINNLLSNAIKFTETGEIVLTVSKVREDAARVMLDFQLRDTGIGIAPEAQSRLFEAFSQADGSTTRKYGGTGLGLVISKRLVALMNGDMRVDSVPGTGSVFSFHAEFEKVPAATGVPVLDGTRVLVVSDQATTRFLVGESLAGAAVPFRMAWQHDAALALIQEAKDAGFPFRAAVVDRPSTAQEIERLAFAVGGRPGAVVVLKSLGEQIEGLGEIPGVTLLAKPLKQRRLLRLLAHESPPVPATAEQMENCGNPAPADRPNLRILLAEDNSVNQKVALGVLRNLGHTATVAANGEQVLAALEVGTYDLIFMDCQMPVMDGFEATRRVRARSIAQPRIIAMTANALPGDRERCLAAGMDDYLTKPIRAEILGEKIAGLQKVAGAISSAAAA